MLQLFYDVYQSLFLNFQRKFCQKMEEKPQKFQLKKWQVTVVGLLTLSLVGFAICLTILISLAPLIEKNIRAVSDFLMLILCNFELLDYIS